MINYITIRQTSVELSNILLLSEVDTWYEFNDMQVSHFDLSRLEEEAFGGKEEVRIDTSCSAPTPDSAWTNVGGGTKPFKGWAPTEMEKSRSAYMLFYRKKENQPDQEVIEDSTDLAKGSMREAEYLKSIVRDIVHRNTCVLKDRYYMDPMYLEFFHNTVQQILPLVPASCKYPVEGMDDSALDLMCVKACLLFTFRTAFRAKKNDRRVKQWANMLEHLLVRSIPSCVWLVRILSSHSAFWLIQLLVLWPDASSREAMSAMIDHSMSQLITAEIDPNFRGPTSTFLSPPRKTSSSLSFATPPALTSSVSPSSSPTPTPAINAANPPISKLPASPATLSSSPVEKARKPTKLQNTTAFQTPTFIGLQSDGLKLYIQSCLIALAQSNHNGGRIPGCDLDCDWSGLFKHFSTFINKTPGTMALATREGAIELLLALYLGDDPWTVEASFCYSCQPTAAETSSDPTTSKTESYTNRFPIPTKSLLSLLSSLLPFTETYKHFAPSDSEGVVPGYVELPDTTCSLLSGYRLASLLLRDAGSTDDSIANMVKCDP